MELMLQSRLEQMLLPAHAVLNCVCVCVCGKTISRECLIYLYLLLLTCVHMDLVDFFSRKVSREVFALCSVLFCD